MSIQDAAHLRLLKISGQDAESFLQGQLSNDVTALNESWHYSAYCSPKGRALAVFSVWRQDDCFYLLTDESVIESVSKRLNMFVLRSKVHIELLNAQIQALYSDTVTQARFSFSVDAGIHTLHWGNRALLINLESQANVRDGAAEPISADENGLSWLTHDIIDALPRVTAATSDQFVPQMLNMDMLNGISFKKGCYTGQEIIARMRYLGKLKQRMMLCQLSADRTAPSIGDKLFDANGKSLGLVVNAVDRYDLFLASVRHENVAQGLYDADQLKLADTIEMPYPLPLE